LAKGDLKSRSAIYAKGILFLGLGFFSAGLMLWDSFSLKALLLLAICIWAFCRAYYFAFYVIEHYVDASYRFAGLIDFARYILGRPRR
jgi:hypothetical protein